MLSISLKYSKNSTKYEYFVEGAAVTEREYYDYCPNKTNMTLTPFNLTCSYPITAEQAWNLANAYWDNQNGCKEGAAGTIFTAKIVVIDIPNSQTDYYRVAFQVEWSANGAREGYECMPPYDIQLHDEILVNAFTGEIKASTYNLSGKEISVEEAMEIAKKHCEIHDAENRYRVERDANEPAPDHIYVIVIYKIVDQRYDFYTRIWVDQYTGEVVFPYYVNGK